MHAQKNTLKVMEPQKSENNNRKTNRSVIITAVILGILILGLGYTTIHFMNKADRLESELDQTAQEKTELTQQYEDLIEQYESLKTNNDTLNAKLKKEQEKVEAMLEDLKKVKRSNRFQIQQYKKELATLRKIMRGYIIQIDSLNQLNQELIVENEDIKEKYQEERTRTEELVEEKEELTTKVEKAAALKAINISVSPLNQRSRTTLKTEKIEKIKTCFTLKENAIAKPGWKTIYLRIADPDGRVFTVPGKLFQYEGDKIAYSAKREVNYDNTATNACIFWDRDRALQAGQYSIDLFLEGRVIGTTYFTLK